MKLKIIGYCLISFLLISPTCVQVSDRQNRKEEINNAAQSMGEHALWKKIEKTKEAIDHTYQKIYALQDSIDQAKYLVKSVMGLGVASIENELLEINDLKMDAEAYTAGVPTNGYGLLLRQLYQRKDTEVAARQLVDMLYFSNELPTESEVMRALIRDKNNFRMYFEEYVDKRAVQTAHTYRRWARLYRKKGMELSQRVLQDKAFAMTDFERIQTQNIARRYVAMSYEFIEKSDSLLLAVTHDQQTFKRTQHAQAEQFLFTQKLFNP